MFVKWTKRSAMLFPSLCAYQQSVQLMVDSVWQDWPGCPLARVTILYTKS